jgi:glycosyltransferase involved in cell wall biosynthesis
LSGKVSILIPVFNRETVLRETIECALNQTYEDIEICISDNCSTDSSWQIIESFSRANSKIKCLRQASNIGPARNWLACTEMATGIYSKILFSDDLITRDWIKSTTVILDRDSDSGFVVTPAIISENPFVGEYSYQLSKDACRIPCLTYIKLQLFGEGHLPVSPGAMIFRTSDLRRSIFVNLKGMEWFDFNSTGAGVDLLISCFTALSYPHITFFPSELAFFRSHSDSITIRNENQKVSEGYRLAKKWLLDLLSKTGPIK